MLIRTLSALITVLSCTASFASAQIRFEVTDLGSINPARGFTQAGGLNDSGAVVGFGMSPSGASHGFLARASGILDLGTLSGSGGSFANAIDDRGRVVGSSSSPLFKTSAFVWEQGVMRELPDLGFDSYALGLDEGGTIVGAARDASGNHRPMAWRDGGFLELELLPGGVNGYASDVNSSNLIVGGSQDATSVQQAVAWVDGEIVQLPILDLGAPWGEPLAVNEQGEIAGASWDSVKGVQTAVVWRRGTVLDLGSLNDKVSRAYDINDRSQVVGQSDVISSGDGRAFLWTDGVLYDLNELIDPNGGWTLYRASGITNDGKIAGTGRSPQGYLRAFLLTPRE